MEIDSFYLIMETFDSSKIIRGNSGGFIALYL